MKNAEGGKGGGGSRVGKARGTIIDIDMIRRLCSYVGFCVLNNFARLYTNQKIDLK